MVPSALDLTQSHWLPSKTQAGTRSTTALQRSFCGVKVRDRDTRRDTHDPTHCWGKREDRLEGMSSVISDVQLCLRRALSLSFPPHAGSGLEFGLVTTCGTGSSDFFCTGRFVCGVVGDCPAVGDPRVTLPFLPHSGLGCHYLHLDKGRCSSDPMLEGCRMYKPLANGVSREKT